MINTPEAWSERAVLHTSSWDAAGWSERGQTQRFLAAARNLRIEDGDTVLDFGCGTGRFHAFIHPHACYVGYDWADGMLDQCHTNGVLTTDFPYASEWDHVVVIGTFNLPGSLVRTHVQLQKLWDVTRKTLVFCGYRGTDERCLKYSAAFMAQVAQDCHATRFTIDAEYLDNDIMLVMRR